MLTVLLLLVIAFFGAAIIHGLIEGAKEGFGMTDEEAKKILEEEQQRKDAERMEQKELYKNLEYDDEDDEEDDEEDEEEDDDEDEEDEDIDIDDILYGYLDKQLDDYERYGIGPDPDRKNWLGHYVNPRLHERKEQRDFKKWLKRQK